MIRIVTDSSCDLPAELVERHRIAVVPLTIRFGDDDFIDGVDLSNEAFWDRLTSGESLPETAAPSVGRFLDAYRELSAEGAEGIVVVCISSKISATYQSARLAADQFPQGVPVRVVDSGLVSLALGLVVAETARAAEAGKSVDDVEAVAVDSASRSNLFAALDTVEYLKRGGRIGTAAAFLGNLLDVKPLIAFDEGAVSAAGRVRTRKRAIKAVLDHVAGLGSVAELAVIHSHPDDLPGFIDSVADVHGAAPLVGTIGPVVGTHAGPGVAGVVYRLG